MWRCANFMGASLAGPARGLPDAVCRSPPLPPRLDAGSRAACPARSLMPERFRGCCPFGAPQLAARGLSRAVSSAHSSLPEPAPGAAQDRRSVCWGRAAGCRAEPRAAEQAPRKVLAGLARAAAGQLVPAAAPGSGRLGGGRLLWPLCREVRAVGPVLLIVPGHVYAV